MHVHVCAHRQLRKQKQEQEQREFEALQEQGLNPYEVYRVRDAEAAAAQAAAQQAARQQQRKAEIADALEAEHRTHRKRVAKQEFDRQVQACVRISLPGHLVTELTHVMP
jgi:predicted  nucleic acid-binding Zn-ribbon protein